jgi:hypothetical protein
MRLAFPLKTRECLRVAGNLLRQELQRYEAVKTCFLGLINDTHASAA